MLYTRVDIVNKHRVLRFYIDIVLKIDNGFHELCWYIKHYRSNLRSKRIHFHLIFLLKRHLKCVQYAHNTKHKAGNYDDEAVTSMESVCVNCEKPFQTRKKGYKKNC